MTLTLNLGPMLRQDLTWLQPTDPQPDDVWVATINDITTRPSADGADPTADRLDWLTWFSTWRDEPYYNPLYDWRMQHIPWQVLLGNCITAPSFDGLVESIATIGLVSPLTVELRLGTWRLYDGHHRLAAALALGWRAIPVRAVPLQPPRLNDDRIITLDHLITL